MVAPVQRCFGQRQGEPDQGIEHVMPVAGTCRDLAGEENPLLVTVRTAGRFDKAQGDATARDQPALAGHGVEPDQVRRAARKPRLQERR
ncbi:MAG: hypothetical protein Q8J99_01740 [Sulfuritalea sp.]|nr:hypothetical protein [Sulfuritalea sp.]